MKRGVAELERELQRAHASELRLVDRASNGNRKSLDAAWRAIQRSNAARAALAAARAGNA